MRWVQQSYHSSLKITTDVRKVDRALKYAPIVVDNSSSSSSSLVVFQKSEFTLQPFSQDY